MVITYNDTNNNNNNNKLHELKRTKYNNSILHFNT